MEFTAKKEDFQYELSLVQGIVEKKHAMAILSNIHLEAREGALKIVSTDLEVTMITSCPLVGLAKEGALTVPARKLFEIVKALPAGCELRCRSQENNWLVLDSGSSHYNLVGLPAEEFPSQPKFDLSGGVAVPARIFRTFIPKVVFAITHDEARYAVGGAQFSLGEEKIRLIATDGHRLSLIEAPLKVENLEKPLELLIPRKALVELRRLVGESGEEGEDVILGEEGNHIFFHFDKRILVARKTEGTFPNYDRVMPKENKISIVFDREAVSSVVRRVSLMSSERSRAIRLQFNLGGLQVTSSNPDIGEGSDLVEVDYPFEKELVVSFNAQYLLEFLGSVEDEQVRMDFKDSATQGLFRPAEDGEYVYRHVIMPMRI